MMEVIEMSVLQDFVCLGGIALFLGLLGYKGLRVARPEAAWNHEGLVISRQYIDLDLAVMCAGLGFLLLGIMQPLSEVKEPSTQVPEAGTIAAGLVLMLMLCLALLTYLQQVRGLHLGELFGLTLVRWKPLLSYVLRLSIPMIVLVLLASSMVSGWLEELLPGGGRQQEMVEAFQGSGSLGLRFLIVLAAVVVAPLTEELLFRGFIYGVLKRYTDAPFAAIISGLFFALIHMHLGSLLPLWLLALVFCFAYERTGTLIAPMLLHALFNGTSIAVMLFA
jgi:uncharacterized protein